MKAASHWGFVAFACLTLTSSISIAYDIKTVDFRDLTDRKLTDDGRAAQKVYGDAWQHAETEHFVYHFVEAKDGEPVLVHAEAYYQWIKDLLKITRPEVKGKGHIFIFSDREIWRTFVRKTPERLPGAEAFTNGIELFLYRDPFWMSTPHTLAHEITHLAVARFIKGTLPLFLNEGFAEFMAMKASAMKTGGDPYSVRALGSVDEKDFIPLKKLVTLKDYPENVEVFYRESELLIRFLVNLGESKLYELLTACADGGDFFKTTKRLYGLEETELSEKFLMYAKTRGK